MEHRQGAHLSLGEVGKASIEGQVEADNWRVNTPGTKNAMCEGDRGCQFVELPVTDFASTQIACKGLKHAAAFVANISPPSISLHLTTAKSASLSELLTLMARVKDNTHAL